MPHHGVIREASTTTKLRVVFNASSKTTSGKSFNDIQMVGPVVQEDLFSILLRFRQHKYVVSSDVEKMYRAITVEPSQRSLQQILFRFKPSDKIQAYTLNTVTYGTASAPYLATKCLVSLSDHCSYPEAKFALRRDFYVDDFLSGGDSISSVIEMCKNVDITLKSAHFYLRKWQSNNKEILNSFLDSSNQNENSNNKTLNLNELLPCKTLGLHWDPSLDNLLFSINLETKFKKITKRNILAIVSQVFDPLGLLGPCTVTSKILIQKLWIDKCDWDSEVSKENQKTFLNFISSLNILNNLRISRWISIDYAVSLELHTFSDASERAYGACTYVRAVDVHGNVRVTLLASRNKVAPIKPTTIPRLELCGAVLASRLHSKVVSSLTLKFLNSYFWTDSTIVLSWLNTSSNQLKTFVRSRVGEIQDCTAGHKWSYVPSKHNPADLVSRGTTTDTFDQCSLWWTGPNFLKHKDIKFPVTPNTHNIGALQSEISLHLSNSENNNKNINSLQNLINKKSNYTKLIRIFAYILRFIHNCQNKNKLTNCLSTTELGKAENCILLLAQQSMFPDEYFTLKSGKPLYNKSRLCSLSPFIDSNNLLRVGGRLNNSFYAYDVKHPILLCSKHHVTQIIFHKEHINLLHAGPQLLLSYIRQKYWPLGGRNLARRVVHSCVRCFRFKSRPIQPIMGDLPSDRTHLEFPFLKTGIDYGGPVLIADRKGRGAKLVKSYICIFVCFAVKALHLELVSDLSKEAFLAALFRFISRRGKPQTIYSDNGTTFVGAKVQVENFERQLAARCFGAGS
ncbi:uncharacterized protein LOC121737656 isoform X1 [Aricia agestis]|uniref:uncharacterized protein LOC121737656 isoform X1 n=1 Tax=Aricia agestis TaxID=91739 RepID=UPI001C209923|nr:uncharacterized protein LOC121737656 isoform X1 [Aricia agestis]